MIPYGKHSILPQDIDAVVDVLENEFLTQGQRVPAFEQALCDYTGAGHAVSVNSGTSGLHVACLALGLGEGDLLWTSPNSFVASANCGRYCGAEIDFVDINPATRNICLDALEHKLETAQQQKRLPKVIVAVHFAGFSCDMPRLAELSQKFGVSIIEDAAHGLGGDCSGEPIGSAKWSDLVVMSFHPVKSITSAEGGAVLTNSPELAARVKRAASHGITREQQEFTGFSAKPWVYEQQSLGFNYRMSDLHAALGLSQLASVDAFVHQRSCLAERYHALLADLPVKLPQLSSASHSAWHLYVIELVDHNRDSLFQHMRERGIGVNVHYIPIHLQPYYRELGFKNGDFPNAEKYYANALTLPLYPGLSADEQDKVVAVLNEALV